MDNKPVIANALRLELQREDCGDALGTPGALTLSKGDELLYQCRTLELPWRDNERCVSCVPTGRYRLMPRKVGKYYERASQRWLHQFALEIENVEGRSHCLVHWGNFLSNTLGCVLVGCSATRRVSEAEDGEGTCHYEHCIGSSVAAYRPLYRHLRDNGFATGGCELYIIGADQCDEGEADLMTAEQRKDI